MLLCSAKLPGAPSVRLRGSENGLQLRRLELGGIDGRGDAKLCVICVSAARCNV